MRTDVLLAGEAEFWTVLRDIRRAANAAMYVPEKLDTDYYAFCFGHCAYTDCSVAVLLDRKPVAALLASVGRGSEGQTEFSFYGVPAIYIEDAGLSIADAERAREAVWGKVGEKILASDVAFLRLPSTRISAFAVGALSANAEMGLSFWQVLDLARTDESLRADVRKSFKHLINKGLSSYDLKVHGAECTMTELEELRILHAEASGRSTRSLESWQMQLKKIQNDEAFLVTASSGGKPVSSAYFIHDRETCYYGSSATPRKDEFPGSSQAVIWKAVSKAREIGCRYFDLGQILFPQQQELLTIHARPAANETKKIPDARELGISAFKKGFGGETKARIDVLWKPTT